MVPAVGAMTRNRLASVSPDQLLDAVLLAPPQPHRNAMSTPRRETPTSNRVASNMIADEPFMSSMIGSSSSPEKGHARVQRVSGPSVRKCKPSPREEAFAALDTVPEPFSYRSASRYLRWDYYEARRWMREGARVKRYSVSREGHRKTDAARRVG